MAQVPRASIVIPVYNHFAHTLACLRALAAHPPLASCEVIVVDDGSSDDTTTALPRVAHLHYHRRATNGGFIAACNDGASLARGEMVVFLNNDTIPQPGWLDALLRTFESNPDVGVSARSCGTRTAGCRKPAVSCFPTAAGGITGGRLTGRSPLRLSSRFRLRQRRGDRACGARCSPGSAASLALRTGHNEDTDLAFAVRAPASEWFTTRSRWSTTKALVGHRYLHG